MGGTTFDADESVFYEFRCTRAGIKVIYRAEPFENDGSTQSNLIKTLKRTMAGEHSRELSVKVFAGHALFRLGFLVSKLLPTLVPVGNMK